MKSISNSALKEAVHIYLEKELEKLKAEVDTVEFSPEFEKRMSRIIKHGRRQSIFRLNTSAKRAVAVAAVFTVLVSVMLSVGAIRQPIIKMLTRDFEDHIEIEVKGDTTEFISEIYSPTYIPEGFAATDELINTSMVSRSYENSQGEAFSFIQISTANNPMIAIDNEHSRHYSLTRDGYELYIADFELDNIKHAYWSENGYIFHLEFYYKIDDDSVMRIVKSNAITGYQAWE